MARAGVCELTLHSGWQLVDTPPGAAGDPEQLEQLELGWRPAQVPGTVAASLQKTGDWSFEQPAQDFDERDWWYRCEFVVPEPAKDTRPCLCFDGLATLAQVWLNGQLVHDSDNMFTSQRVDVAGKLMNENQLLIRFASLRAALKARRPRPRWRAPMISEQKLRFVRTTLLGRTPGWSPPAAAVGPWRPVRVEWAEPCRVQDVDLETGLSAAGATGTLRLKLQVESQQCVSSASAQLRRSGTASVSHSAELDVRELSNGLFELSVKLELANVAVWWPHTHGQPSLYALDVDVQLQEEAEPVRVVEGRPVGFRSVELDTSHDGFELRVNGQPIFCRGACWTPPDPVSLMAPPELVRETLGAAKRAGMNMVRVGGTMVYETDAFYAACDELGLLVWQDFMFANMDYPEEDSAFSASVQGEVQQQLRRWQGHPSIAVLCGDSEGEQQAAMWGAPREQWNRPLFRSGLREMTEQLLPNTPYWPSSASGGAFPHQPSSGTSSYYGVGAYLRPLEDARRSGVRFASECLAFANVPDDVSLELWGKGTAPRVHQPEWKARTPRDLGAGWDFDDVRDHYLERLFGVRPLELRYADHSRYLELSRVVVGEAIQAAVGEWRRRDSACRGALVWFLRDLWPGAGWGLIDAYGRPKAPYYYFRRAAQPVSCALHDEGLNGAAVSIVNDSPAAVRGELEIQLFQNGEVSVGNGRRAIEVQANSQIELPVASLLAGFTDMMFAYRFGPPALDLIVASLNTADGQRLAQAFLHPLGLPAKKERDVGLSAEPARAISDPEALPRDVELSPDRFQFYSVTVSAERFAQSVAVDAADYQAEDNYFHLAPGDKRTLLLWAPIGAAPPKGHLRPLNSDTTARILPAK